MSKLDTRRAVPHRVVLASIGTGGFSHLPVLRRLRPVSDARLAELMLQAPSELALVGDAAAAEAISATLNESGLRTEAVPAEEPFQEGCGEFDIAVHLDDPERAPAIIALLCGLLGVDHVAARELLFGAPPALLGNVSAATVEALAPRFAALGATLVASRRDEARYDLVVGDCPPRLHAHLLERAGRERGAMTDDGPLVVENLDRQAAERLLAEVVRSSSRASVLDRAFERFEVRIDACPGTSEAARCLIELTGMPPAVAGRIPANTPIVLLGDVDRARAQAALGALSKVGARAVADLVTFRRYRVRIERATRADAAERTIERVTGRAERIGALPHVLDATLAHGHARWLAVELCKAGDEARVIAA